MQINTNPFLRNLSPLHTEQPPATASSPGLSPATTGGDRVEELGTSAVQERPGGQSNPPIRNSLLGRVVTIIGEKLVEAALKEAATAAGNGLSQLGRSIGAGMRRLNSDVARLKSAMLVR